MEIKNEQIEQVKYIDVSEAELREALGVDWDWHFDHAERSPVVALGEGPRIRFTFRRPVGGMSQRVAE